MTLGCPVHDKTVLQNLPWGSILFRLETAIRIGTCVNWPRQLPTTMLVRPAIAACTALWPRIRQNAELPGVRRYAADRIAWGRCT